jgi:hypothetical protein
MVSEAQAAEQAGAPGGRARGVLGALVKIALGLVAGAAIAEAAFDHRDRGAFQHLNVYRPDAELGVRLQPGATERLAAGKNPLHSVRINAQGYRGADWPAPGDDEILVLGDSQVFGLGVEEGETASAVLGSLVPGATVLNAGVPTYGPPEYARVAAEVLGQRHPKAIVVVVNLANDLFEAGHPNRERHAVWDGWAVRAASKPAQVTPFPGRDFLYRRSHAFFAARAFWYAHGPRFDDRDFSPRRTFREVVLAGVAAEDDAARAAVETERAARAHVEEIQRARVLAGRAQTDLDQLIEGKVRGDVHAPAYHAGIANPGDIVGYTPHEEWEEPIFATAELIKQGAAYRRLLEDKLREKSAGDAALGADVSRTLAARDETQARLQRARSEPAEVVRAWSPVTPALREIKALADAKKARLFVVALPLDVQVSAAEWAKYGEPPLDMAPADVLVADVLDDALALGATPVDVMGALRAAEPGAFLDGDIHLTPRGQRALAARLAAALAAPPPLPRPRKGTPAGRSRPPGPHAWEREREANVRGSTAAECETHLLREWLRVDCKKRKASSPAPLGARVIEGGHGEASVTAGPDELTLLAPIVEGDRFVAELSWANRTQRLVAVFPRGARFPEATFQAPDGDKAPRPQPPPLDLEPLCGCLKAHDAALTCPGQVLAPSADCARTYAGACDKIIACSEGDPEAPPACPEGSASAGMTPRCYPLCGPEAPCAAGTCTEWQGGRLCM